MTVLTSRLFLALPLSKNLQLLLAEHCQPIHIPQYRWVEADNLHITVHFLGNVPQPFIPRLIETYQPVIDQFSDFSLSFKRIAFAPPQDPGRMIWAIFDANPTYQQLVTETKRLINQFLREHHCTVADANQDIIPHITLARRENGGNSPSPLPPLKQPTVQPLAVTAVELMQSQLTPEGSVYTVLHTFALDKS